MRALALLVYAPWPAFQRYVDQLGDRLVKWHLAGVEDPADERSPLRTIVDAYAGKTLGEIAVDKLENVGTLVWHPRYDEIAATEGWKTGSTLGELRIVQAELFVLAALPMSLTPLALVTRRAVVR